ncbi:MAG: preprotein translocase subunit SecG [bacterium]|nr:preprotein translocase subunit SecG [bacterium]
MKNIVTIAQLIVSVLLVISILLQQKGAGLSEAFGGDSVVYQTRRGFEKILFWGTVILAVLFFGLGIVTILI